MSWAPVTNQELQSYACSSCKAKPGNPCMTYAGNSRPGSHPTPPHQARWDAMHAGRARALSGAAEGASGDPVVAGIVRKMYGPAEGTFTAEDISRARSDLRGECTCEYTPVGPDTYVLPATDIDPHCPVHEYRHTGMASHGGYAEHSHEVRPDHKGVERVVPADHWHAVSEAAKKDLQVLIDAAQDEIGPPASEIGAAADRLMGLLDTLAQLDES